MVQIPRQNHGLKKNKVICLGISKSLDHGPLVLSALNPPRFSASAAPETKVAHGFGVRSHLAGVK